MPLKICSSGIARSEGAYSRSAVELWLFIPYQSFRERLLLAVRDMLPQVQFQSRARLTFHFHPPPFMMQCRDVGSGRGLRLWLQVPAAAAAAVAIAAAVPRRGSSTLLLKG